MVFMPRSYLVLHANNMILLFYSILFTLQWTIEMEQVCDVHDYDDDDVDGDDAAFDLNFMFPQNANSSQKAVVGRSE